MSVLFQKRKKQEGKHGFQSNLRYKTPTIITAQEIVPKYCVLTSVKTVLNSSGEKP